MIYEIINMSDPYTIDTDDRAAACLACLMLGEGRYGLRSVSDGNASGMPLFLFGGAEEWWQKEFGHTLDKSAETVGRMRVAAALETVLIGSESERLELVATMAAITDPEERRLFREKHQDRERSSLNDIGSRAYKLAAKMRELHAKEGELIP